MKTLYFLYIHNSRYGSDTFSYFLGIILLFQFYCEESQQVSPFCFIEAPRYEMTLIFPDGAFDFREEVSSVL